MARKMKHKKGNKEIICRYDTLAKNAFKTFADYLHVFWTHFQACSFAILNVFLASYKRNDHPLTNKQTKTEPLYQPFLKGLETIVSNEVG
jgi:hypothetical protein